MQLATAERIKKLTGYTAQARYYAAHMSTDAAGDWIIAGWTRLSNGAVKPVFTLTNGTPVVIIDGASHLTVELYRVSSGDIRQTEDECYLVKGGR